MNQDNRPVLDDLGPEGERPARKRAKRFMVLMVNLTFLILCVCGIITSYRFFIVKQQESMAFNDFVARTFKYMFMANVAMLVVNLVLCRSYLRLRLWMVWALVFQALCLAFLYAAGVYLLFIASL